MYIAFLTSLITIPICSTLNNLVSKEKNIKVSSFKHRRDFTMKNDKFINKKLIGLIVLFLIICFCHYATLVILNQLDTTGINTWVTNYIITFLVDMIITQSVKVWFNFALLVYLGTNSTNGGCVRPFLFKFLNRVIAASFI